MYNMPAASNSKGSYGARGKGVEGEEEQRGVDERQGGEEKERKRD